MPVSDVRERAERVLAVVGAHADAAQREWLERALPGGTDLGNSVTGFARPAFAAAFAGVGRRFRQPALTLSSAELASLAAEGFVEPVVLTLADLARIALLLRAIAVLPDAEHVAFVTELVRKGDNAERVAVLRALMLLPEPLRFVELAIDSCRTNVLEVFEAVASHNAYAAQCFGDANFNQLVMKSMFMGVSLDRVYGWRARVNPELSRMAADFAAERRAAGRPVPEGVAQIHAIMEAR